MGGDVARGLEISPRLGVKRITEGAVAEGGGGSPAVGVPKGVKPDNEGRVVKVRGRHQRDVKRGRPVPDVCRRRDICAVGSWAQGEQARRRRRRRSHGVTRRKGRNVGWRRRSPKDVRKIRVLIWI